MKRIFSSILTVAFSLTAGSVLAQMDVTSPLWVESGRIVVSSDGNEHDWDDWAGSPMTLAILSSQKLQDKLTLYTYADHVWGSNQERYNVKGMSAYEHMRESVLVGAEMFGFENTRFVCAVDNAEVAYNAMRDEINKSSESSPLFIIGAGPMQVIGEGLNRADADKRKYVTVISHSNWNNNHSDKPDNKWPSIHTGTPQADSWDAHSGWTFQEMIDEFGEGKDEANFVQIKDQNHGFDKYTALQCDRSNFDWLRVSPVRFDPYYKAGSWDWLYTRLESCAVKNDTVFDVSDAGMVVYLLTGNERVSPNMIREMMESVAEK